MANMGWIYIRQIKKFIGYTVKTQLYFHLDENECELDSALCQPGTCMNTIGGYKCDCQEGYVPSEDGRKCIGRFVSVILQSFHLVHCVKSVFEVFLVRIFPHSD